MRTISPVRQRPSLSLFAIVVLALALLAPLVPQVAVRAQTTILVTSSTDSGPGSLRQAVLDAQPGDTITFADGLTTINLTSRLTINKTLIIQGPGQDVLTLSGGGVTQVLDIYKPVGSNAEVEISGLTISGGGNTSWGAGVWIGGATVTISDSTISGNHATGDIASGGGINNGTGTLVIVNSTITGNTSTSTEGYAQAGAIKNGNGTLTIINSTISGNTAWAAGTGNSAFGGAIYNTGALVIATSTISGNTAIAETSPNAYGGGIVNHTVLDDPDMVIGSSTIANNTAANGSSIEIFSGSVILHQTILASNVSDNCRIREGLDGSIISSGYNLSSDNSCYLTQTTDLPVRNPQLGDLADNGGPTWTHAIDMSSPAYNAGDDLCLSGSDQRGVSRPQFGTCDIGAFELASPPTLDLPEPMNVEATSADGALVTFPVSAVDFNGGELDVDCDYQSGDHFEFGTTPVKCSATDSLGKQTEGTFTITVADNTPPAIEPHADMTIEATGPDGEVVDFIVTATDTVDPDPAVTCTPPSGSVFEVGTTEVSCTATDNADNTSEPATFDVTVEDTIPPVIDELEDMTVVATGPGGAEVDFQVTATDRIDPDPAITCTPSSGSLFEIGSTLVSCTATDDAENTSAPVTFTITVLGGGDLLATLIADTSESDIPAFLKPRLLVFLNTADLALERERTAIACSTLQTFSTQVVALSPRYITPVLATELGERAQVIRQVLGC